MIKSRVLQKLRSGGLFESQGSVESQSRGLQKRSVDLAST